jgi:hypothetical protein
LKLLNRIAYLTFSILLAMNLVGDFMYAADAESGAATTIILIRHVERDNFFIVTAQGHERARALVTAVGGMGITAIYSPDLARNLDTVKPLAKHLGLDITLIPRLSKKAADELVSQILAKHAGEVILLVGNGSGNLRALHHHLGAAGEGPYAYGDLFIYEIPEQGPVKIVKSRFGQ